MEYTVEDLSPIKKKVNVTVPAEEVDSAIAATGALYKSRVSLDGFRKGKVPMSVIEKRFHDQIYEEAHDDLINVHINQVMEKLDSRPVSPIKMDGDTEPLQKGKPYSYAMQFEVMPVFDLPAYENLEVEQTEAIPSTEMEARLLERLGKEESGLVPVNGDGPATDGQIVNLDFEVYEDGKELKNARTKDFDLELGSHASLQEFEDFIKTIPVGHTAEREIQFPEDFIAESVAGKKILIKATVNAIKERKSPDLDDNFAKRLGKENLEELKKDIAKAYSSGMANLYKGEAQQKLLNKIVEQTDFMLPEAMVQNETSFLAFDYAERLARHGKRAFSNREEMEKFVDSFKEAGKARTREKIVLLSIARKEKLQIAPRELEAEIVKSARKMDEEPQKYYQQLQDTGLIFQLHDNLLCDKAMDLIYSRASVKMVEQKMPASNIEEKPENGAEAVEGME